MNLIRMLLEYEADLDNRNFDWKTPPDLLKGNATFKKELFSRFRKTARMTRNQVRNIPNRPTKCSSKMKRICQEFPVYFRYQWAGLNPSQDGSSIVSWVRTDSKVGEILYPHDDSEKPRLRPKVALVHYAQSDNTNHPAPFLVDCENQFYKEIISDWFDNEKRVPGQETEHESHPGDDDENERIKNSINTSAWRWINFPANNVSPRKKLGCWTLEIRLIF